MERAPAGAARQRVGGGGPVGGQVLEPQLEPPAELGRYVDPNGKMRALRADWVFQLGVEEALGPEKIGVERQPWTFHMSPRRGIARKGTVRPDGHSRLARHRD